MSCFHYCYIDDKWWMWIQTLVHCIWRKQHQICIRIRKFNIQKRTNKTRICNKTKKWKKFDVLQTILLHMIKCVKYTRNLMINTKYQHIGIVHFSRIWQQCNYVITKKEKNNQYTNFTSIAMAWCLFQGKKHARVLRESYKLENEKRKK